MASMLADWLYALSSCFFCFSQSPNLTLNHRSFKIIRQLGEGGFSYVYLVEDHATHTQYALKKIYCPTSQSLDRAIEEVNSYRRFSHANIIKTIDHAQVSDKSDATAKIVYILLPYYCRGNLQDTINSNLVNHTQFPEDDLLKLMMGVCEALKEMHRPRSFDGRRKAARDRSRGNHNRHNPGTGSPNTDEDGDERDGPSESRPLMESSRDADAQNDGSATRSYVHRDIKPANIMIEGLNTAILMDFGSLVESPIKITSRSVGIAQQDIAAEHSTLPYRAPELFDAKTNTILDTKADIWSLGCVIYACLVGKSPFEARVEETGGSLNLCIQGGDWRFPDELGQTQLSHHQKQQQHNQTQSTSPSSSTTNNATTSKSISDPVKHIVRRCLCVDPAERADVDELIDLIQAAQDGISA